MKSIVIKEPNNLIIEDKDITEPGRNEVRVKVKMAGICGSDSHIYHGHNPFAKYPRVIGHEFFGIIDAVGEGVDKSRIGERVSVDPVISCGHCYPCSVNRPNVCTSLIVLGVHRDGGFSEYTIVPSKNAYTIPNDISDEFAVMVEPFTIAANVTSHLKPTEKDTVLLYGAGPMGLTTIQVLRGVYNVKEIIIADRIPERLNMALTSGADRAINNTNISLKKELNKLNINPTIVIDAACHPTILPEAIDIASPAGRIAIMGFSSDPCVISQQAITSKELSIFSTRLNAEKFPIVIEWLKNKQIDPSKLITHRYHYTEVIQAMETFEKDQARSCKVLLQFT